MCLEYDTADYVTDVFSCSKVVYAVIMQFIYDVSMKTYSYDSSQIFKHDLWRVKSDVKLSQNHVYTIILKTNKTSHILRFKGSNIIGIYCRIFGFDSWQFISLVA